MADAPSADELARVRGSARCLADAVTIERAVDRMAQSITEKLSQADPLLLTVMNGGLVPAAMLLRRLDFPLQVDYTHLTRYGLRTTGDALGGLGLSVGGWGLDLGVRTLRAPYVRTELDGEVLRSSWPRLGVYLSLETNLDLRRRRR